MSATLTVVPILNSSKKPSPSGSACDDGDYIVAIILRVSLNVSQPVHLCKFFYVDWELQEMVTFE